MRIPMEAVHALILLVATNAAPVIVTKLIGARGGFPLDFGRTLADGERLFGAHKTWRGLFVGVGAGALAADLLDESVLLGIGFALASLLADALSSFIKRRMRLEPGTEFIGLDQLAEALLPLAIFAAPLSLDLKEVLAVCAAFIALDVLCSPLRQRSWFAPRR